MFCCCFLIITISYVGCVFVYLFIYPRAILKKYEVDIDLPGKKTKNINFHGESVRVVVSRRRCDKTTVQIFQRNKKNCRFRCFVPAIF